MNSLQNSSLETTENLSARQNKVNVGYAPTIMGNFDESLTSLIEKMKQSSPHFIRCIRPNTQKSSVVFQDGLVLRQLVTTGTIEIIKIRQSGYPVRIEFLTFVQRFVTSLNMRKLTFVLRFVTSLNMRKFI